MNLKNLRSFQRALVCGLIWLSFHFAGHLRGDSPRDIRASRLVAQRSRSSVSSSEFLRRYPVGKAWRSVSVFRANGSGSSTNWGLRGDVEVLLTSRYKTETKVLSVNEVGGIVEMKLSFKVLDAASTRVLSHERFRLADFDDRDPLFNLAVEAGTEMARDALPGFQILLRAGKLIEKADPGYERTLTSVASKIGLRPSMLEKADDLQWVEKPQVFSERSFNVTWTSDVGITKLIETTPPGKPRLDSDDIGRLTQNAGPLAEAYVLPSMSKREGESWTLDADQASSIIVGRGDVSALGDVELRYVDKTRYRDKTVRRLRITRGNLDVELSGEQEGVQLNVDRLRGEMLSDDRDGMLQMAHGTGDVRYEKLTKNHFLFRARISRDFRCEWRYEAIRLP